MAQEQKQRTIKVQFDKGETREEILLGKNYLVVPCVAMVEGVRFGANQDGAELGLAAEFGELPIAWANRPLVLNHPKVGSSFVSANSPEILEEYQFGLTMNPEIKDNKLHLEAWIDVDRVEELGGEFSSTLERIRAEEDVEVSVGFFCDVEKKKGKFKGQAYAGIWRNVKPDHLAVLAEGLTGACSVEDGCGVPRLNNTESETNMAKELKTKSTTTPTTPEVTAQCSCGGNHAQGDHADVDDNKPVTQGGLKSMIEKLIKPFTQSTEEKVLEAHIASGLRTQREQIVQTVDGKMFSRDVHNMIQRALSEKLGTNSYSYLLGYTSEVAIYESYSSSSNRFMTYQIGVNVSSEKVEFVGEPEEVILQTKIVPQAAKVTSTTTPAVDNVTPPKTQENDVTTEVTPTTPAPIVNTTTAPTKVLTTQEYIDNAPAEVKEVLQSSMKLHSERKASAIEAIMKVQGNKFTKERLQAKSLDDLEEILSVIPNSSYKGLAVVTNGANPQVEETSSSSERVPAPRMQWNKDAKDKSAA